MDPRSIPKRSTSLQSLQNGFHIHKTQHSVNYVVYEERAHNKSSSRTDLFRKRSTSFSVGLPRTVCGSLCVLSVLIFRISMLIPSDESFGKSAITLSTMGCQRTPHACAAAQLRFVTERKKKKRSPFYNKRGRAETLELILEEPRLYSRNLRYVQGANFNYSGYYQR